MNNQLFRQVSIERLSSPEQLDEVLRVTSVKLWIALAAIAMLLVTAVIWGYQGTIVTTAAGQGVIVRSGGVLNVVTRSAGVVLNIGVKPGDRVKANQVIATISQPVLTEKIKATMTAIEEASRQKEVALQIHKDSSRLQVEAMERQRANTEQQIKELSDREKLENDQIAVEEQLLAKGLVTKQQVLEIRQRVVGIQDQIETSKTLLKQFDAQEFAAASQPRQDEAGMQSSISGLRRDLAALQEERRMAETVVSPFDGEVLELKIYPGSTVTVAQPVLSVQPNVRNLELLAYLPSLQAKDMRSGMEVQVSPSNIKREEYGFIDGEVVYVADYPATSAAMMRNFENESLVQALSRSGPITEVRALLKGDTSTFNGFKWSNSKGPRVQITSGTLVLCRLVTRRQRPITLLFPYVRETMGLS